MPAYEEPQEGEWVQPVRRGYKMACCDCGLVHNVDFRVIEGRAQLRMFRNNRSTAMVRRHRNITLTHEDALTELAWQAMDEEEERGQ